jgi:phosphoglycerate dehydrogenase-like enzyme
MIGESQLRMMKPTATLINTARGTLVDEAALAKALKEDWISGAAVDVFDPEIPAPDNPLLDEDIALKTLYSPHAAAQNAEAQIMVANIQVEDCLKGLKGERPQYVVNPDVLPKWQQRINAC